VELWALTGGSGFLGLHLSRRLLAQGFAVRSLDLERGPVPGVQALVGDLRSARSARALCQDADVVVHAAAALPIRGSSIGETNVAGTATVLAAAAEAGVRRVVFISSSVVYGIPGPEPSRETLPPAPIDAYGASKVEAERICREFGARGLEVTILRPQAFVGPERLGIFGILFGWIREGRRIYMLGPGTNRYQLLSVDDLVEAVVLSGLSHVSGETLNLGATEFGTVADDLAGLIRHAGSRSRLTSVPARPVRLLLRALDAAGLSPLSSWHYRSADKDCSVSCTKAERLLGWRPRLSNLEALSTAYDWFAARVAQTPVEIGQTHRTSWDERALGLVRKVS
jgi:nucleoside-diphosphate-sugar epimerase